MGSNKSTLSESKMKTCMEVTFLSRSEINRVHRLYKSLQKAFDTEPPFSVTDRVRCTTLRESAQFANNPLGALLLRAFSGDGNRTMSFDEMLDLFSVFGRRAPFHVKCIYAFRIYDVDQDGVIGYDDIYDLTVLLTLGSLNTEEIKLVAEQILQEADLDGDKKLSYPEFERIVEKSANFGELFRISI